MLVDELYLVYIWTSIRIHTQKSMWCLELQTMYVMIENIYLHLHMNRWIIDTRGMPIEFPPSQIRSGWEEGEYAAAFFYCVSLTRS